MQMTNAWNRIAYRLWAPIYDVTISQLFKPGRRRALAALAPQPGERVLLIGVGTGLDLPGLPAGAAALGVDLSPAMLAQARRKLPRCRAAVQLVQGDAQAPVCAAESCDAAVLNLILTVVPDGHACLTAALHALRPRGRLVIFDKFQPDAAPLTRPRRALNFFSTLLGTDITRRFGDLRRGCPVEVVLDEPSLGGGLYRVIVLRKL
ncbi:MAG: methyltransferase domain-containing protein [Anaerolineales bacterium]|nr:methyltransferase domain-containing protein [Anaerolineales bacterium]